MEKINSEMKYIKESLNMIAKKYFRKFNIRLRFKKFEKVARGFKRVPKGLKSFKRDLKNYLEVITFLTLINSIFCKIIHFSNEIPLGKISSHENPSKKCFNVVHISAMMLKTNL